MHLAFAFLLAVPMTPWDDVCSASLLAFILVGQSNMSGVNADPAPPVKARVQPRIWMLDNAWNYRHGTEPLDSNVDQIDTVSRDSAPAIGPGMYFAERLAEVLTATVVLVPAARGNVASPYFRRVPPNAVAPVTAYRRTQLYGSALARFEHVLVRYGATPGGVFYAQGEQNARISNSYPKTEAEALTWSDDTQEQFQGWRDDLNDPDLIIVYTQMAPNPPAGTWQWWNAIRAEQASIQSPIDIMVPTVRAARDGHNTAAEQRVIGRNAADAWLIANGC